MDPPKPSHVQLSKCSLFILFIEKKGGPTHGFKDKESTLLDRSLNFLVLEEIYRVLLDVPLCVVEDECSRVQTEIPII